MAQNGSHSGNCELNYSDHWTKYMNDFLMRHSKKRKESFFWNMKKLIFEQLRQSIWYYQNETPRSHVQVQHTKKRINCWITLVSVSNQCSNDVVRVGLHRGVHERTEAIAVSLSSAVESGLGKQTPDNCQLFAHTCVVKRRSAVVVRYVWLTSTVYIK